MKRIVCLLCCGLLLTGCGSTNTAAIDNLTASQTDAAQTDAPQTTAADAGVSEPDAAQTTAVRNRLGIPDSSNGEYDVDLTKLNSNMVYAQVYDLVYGEKDYTGQMIRAKGVFDYYIDPQTNQEYFAILISDATACCAQGIEFELAGEHTYPDDYPELGAEITVHGVFNTYEDAYGSYVQLKDAVIE